METFHLMTGRYIRHFDQNSLIFLLSLGEIFSYFATSWGYIMEMILPDILSWQQVEVVQTVFSIYSEIYHYSKCIRLALTDFNKNGVFYSNWIWLQLSQILTKIHRRECEKHSILARAAALTSQKSEKHAWDTRGYSFKVIP